MVRVKKLFDVVYELPQQQGNTPEVFSNLIRILIARNQCNVQNGFTHG